jgi:competence protein ComGC
MKTYNQIFFKHFRGSFHILTIVILSSLLIIFVQGCKKENNYVEKRNLQVELKLVEFKNALLEAKINIEKMKKEELNIKN